ncbi:MAG: TIGR03767 family metallophosphoesterase [Actinobacteria bacterium]|nr:TIGR03767 family metallophosphoesterase [Actinomycetota bacterium]
MAFRRGAPNEKGWRELEPVPSPPHTGEHFPAHSEPLLLLHHLSDLHVCDAQSPLRPEYLDRWADPTSPIRDLVGTIGTYRPHAMLTPHVVEAMVTSLNQMSVGPLSGHAINAAIVTGDTTDNAQENEVNWYLALLDGVELRPDSGSFDRYEGVIDDASEHYDIKYWHPHGTPRGLEDDEPRALYGFPVIPKLLDSCRAPFKATGLDVPWYAVHGNHDALLQGTVTANEEMKKEMMGNRRYEALPSSLSLAETLAAFNEVGPADFPTESDAPFVLVTADVERRAVDRGKFAALHRQSPGKPEGHGFSEKNVENKTMYYSTDIGGVRLIVLDSVNLYGGWQGSLDEEQFIWLENEIQTTQLPVVLASHHPLSKMFNDYSLAERRVCLDEITTMLLKYPRVILWLAGHEHRHHVEWIGSEVGIKGFWQIETASHVDWPQQSRTVEVVRADDGDIYIGLTVVDHAGPAKYEETQTPIGIASLSRTLSANVWQKREELGAKHPFEWAEGRVDDRNVVLKIQKH